MILRDALRVLIANWDGSYTVPSRTLYPHQWSWDSAFIAIGHARWSPRRARTELLSLFGAQWEDGRVPHIVFNPAVPDVAYFPGPEFWATRSPSGYATSGIVQPPVHAMAAWRAHLAEPDHGFLARIYPRLVAQQEFLRTQRRGIDGLISIVHPWESGMDNSPCWDLPLNAVEPMPDGVCRRDLAHISPAERPTDRDYERYIALARAYRDTGYRGTCAFQVEDPLFNTAYGMAEHTLAEIAAVLGHDPAPHRAEAERITAAMVAHLYQDGLFHPRDAITGCLIRSGSAAGLTPLILPGLPRDVANALIGTGLDLFGLKDGVLPSFAPAAPEFDPVRYWRGPSWINLAWLVWQGLKDRRPDLAAILADGMISAVTTSGFHEYFDPFTLRGHGSGDFSWSAALVVDVIAEHGLKGVPLTARELGQQAGARGEADHIGDHVPA